MTAFDCTDQHVVTRLYERLGRVVVAKTRGIVGREDVAREILQETFTRLWEAGPRFASETAAYAWVYRTSHNLAIDYLRAAFTKSEPLPEALVAAHRGDAAETRQLLRKLLGKLSEEELSLYVYNVVDRMTHGEIAALGGISTKTVARHLQRIEEKIARAKERIRD